MKIPRWPLVDGVVVFTIFDLHQALNVEALINHKTFDQ